LPSIRRPLRDPLGAVAEQRRTLGAVIPNDVVVSRVALVNITIPVVFDGDGQQAAEDVAGGHREVVDPDLVLGEPLPPRVDRRAAVGRLALDAGLEDIG